MLLSDSDHNVRRAAGDALAAHGPDAARLANVALAHELVRDELRILGAHLTLDAFRPLPDPKPISAWIEVLQNDHGGVVARCLAARCLGRSGSDDRRVVEALSTALNGLDPDVVCAAAEGLADLHPNQDALILDPWRPDRDDRVLDLWRKLTRGDPLLQRSINNAIYQIQIHGRADRAEHE